MSIYFLKNEKWQCFILFILIIALLIPVETVALNEVTHRTVNEIIADKNSICNNFSLHRYLIENVGFKDGVETEINKKWILKWLGDGGEHEDSGLRPLNHFHNPITNRGLTAFDYSALSWATLPAGTQSPESYFWNDVRFYYYNALTYKDKFSRDINYARTFRGIGQVMHLLQDMSVPAHTRNDAHVPLLGGNDDYEGCFVKTAMPPISSYTPKSFNPISSFPLTVQNLFDTDQYNGANPDITIQPAIGLAEYTNANFLSADNQCEVTNSEVQI